MKATIFKAALGITRAVLFGLLLFFRPLVFLASLGITVLSLIGFFGTLIFMRHETTPLFFFLTVGVGAASIGALYTMLLWAVAPDGYMG